MNDYSEVDAIKSIIAIPVVGYTDYTANMRGRPGNTIFTLSGSRGSNLDDVELDRISHLVILPSWGYRIPSFRFKKLKSLTIVGPRATICGGVNCLMTETLVLRSLSTSHSVIASSLECQFTNLRLEGTTLTPAIVNTITSVVNSVNILMYDSIEATSSISYKKRDKMRKMIRASLIKCGVEYSEDKLIELVKECKQQKLKSKLDVRVLINTTQHSMKRASKYFNTETVSCIVSTVEDGMECFPNARVDSGTLTVAP